MLLGNSNGGGIVLRDDNSGYDALATTKLQSSSLISDEDVFQGGPGGLTHGQTVALDGPSASGEVGDFNHDGAPDIAAWIFDSGESGARFGVDILYNLNQVSPTPTPTPTPTPARRPHRPRRRRPPRPRRPHRPRLPHRRRRPPRARRPPRHRPRLAR